MTLISAEGIHIRRFLSWTDREAEEELYRLTQLGLLQSGELFRVFLHPVIRDVAVEELKPSVKNCGVLLQTIQQECTCHGVEFPDRTQYLRVAQNVIDYAEKDDVSAYILFLQNVYTYNEKYKAPWELEPIFRELHTPFVVNQPSYSMLNRWIEEDGLYGMAAEEGFGFAVFSPLQQGLLTDKYLHGIPADSRYGKNERMQGQITPGRVAQLQALHGIAENRGQTLSQLALAWCLRDARVATVLAGASRAEHVRENALAAQNTAFSAEEISAIEEILG